MEGDGDIAKCTVNPEVKFPQTHACIKNWSENEGVLMFLLANKILIHDDTAMDIEMCPCLRIADDVYKEYLEVLERFNNETEDI
ncbi:hypothetical protein KPL28_02855 [Clostridium algidicarnis]|nr:hypothetical protein [Clostridium algidicarnis]